MKAWKAFSPDWAYSTVIFAETEGKARAAAMHTDCCEDMMFTEIAIRRCKELDGEHRGHTEMDWYDPLDRLALVKNGWMCEYFGDDDCETCAGKDLCEIKQVEWDYMAHCDIRG